jgi:hypothetical protein
VIVVNLLMGFTMDGIDNGCRQIKIKKTALELLAK